MTTFMLIPSIVIHILKENYFFKIHDKMLLTK